MPVPHGVISTSEGPVDPTVEEVVEVAELVEEVLPEAQDGVLTEEE
jgi:hypothetical protein